MARRGRTFWLGCALLCAVQPVAAAPSSGSEPPALIGSVEFEWSAPAQCPPQAQVIADARSLVAHDPTSDAAPVHARAIAAMQGDGRWRLTMMVGDWTRTVDGATCEEVARAAALFLALLVDPIRSEPPAAPPPPPQPKPSQRARPVVRPTPPRATLSPIWTAGIGAIGDLGTMPRAALWGTLDGALWLDRTRLGLALAAGLPMDARASGVTVAELTPYVFVASICYGWRAGPLFDWGPCARSELGWIRSQTTGISAGGTDAWAFWGAGGAVFAGLRPAHAFRLEASLGATVPIVHPAFRVEGIGIVHEVGIAGRAELVGSVVF